MSYEVKIIADSIGPKGTRLTTYQLKYPRFIHSELLTHRSFSRNASSSRAIPFLKMLEWIEVDPAMPIYWGSNQKGMQAAGPIESTKQKLAELAWTGAFGAVSGFAKILNSLGLHKQIINRMMEPWGHINVVLTATDFDNFFCLRIHKDAQPEIQKLAVMMARAMIASTPVFLPAGEWHLPYVQPEEMQLYPIEDLIKFSAARCCRVSYLTMEGKSPSPEKDIALHDDLISSFHMSPLEHQAQSVLDNAFRPSNLRDWLQYRKTIPMDAYQKFDYEILKNFENDFRVD